MRELWLEIGFGSGEHMLAQIAAHPDVGVIGCEVFENGLCSLLSHLVCEGEEATGPLPENLRLWDADARVLLRALPPGCLTRVFLLFPDPWPKQRHAKRRFVQPANIELLAKCLTPGGEWRIASDDPTYQAWVDAQMSGSATFELRARHLARPDTWPPTRYEAKALRAGRSPMYWSFIRSGAIARMCS
jgi:tRNA (guanine-N7-)-methyltransferase